MKKNLLIFLLFFLSSCGGTSKNSNIQNRDTQSYFKSSGVLKYFQQSIPIWANFRQESRCFLNQNYRYLKFFEMNKQMRLSYSELVQFQLMYNHAYQEEKKMSLHNNKDYSLSFKDEEKIFYRVAQNIQSKIFLFVAPTYKRVNLIWIDFALGLPKETKRLKVFLNSKKMDLGHPVLVSKCLSRENLSNFRKEFMPNHSGAGLISAEMFSTYNKETIQVPSFGIDLTQFFRKSQKLYFYTKWKRPSTFRGKLIIKKMK